MSEALARDIEMLAELFKAGGWTEIRVESAGVSLLLSRDAGVPGLGATLAPPPAQPVAPTPPPPAALVPSASVAAPGSVEPGWLPVTAPNLGTFYRSPKPGAAPFVELGQAVTADTEICLLEVMKLFTSVKAGVAGTVVQVTAQDAELVEGGRILFYIDPE